MPEKPENPFLPRPAVIKETQELTPDVKLFKVEFLNPEDRFDYKPGQFGFVSAFGVGESAISITSVAHRQDGLQFAVRRVGTVTSALHELEPGSVIGVRGPCGNTFPLEEYRGKSILIIGGGIGLAPLRPIIYTVIDFRDRYGDLTLIYGARTPQDLVFASEYKEWASAAQTRLELTVDRGDESWTGRVALVPQVVKELKPSPQNTVAIICGPPIMIRFTLKELKDLGFTDSQIVTTLESKMKCGIGKCARCNIGEKYVCLDGPVFTFEQIAQLREEF